MKVSLQCCDVGKLWCDKDLGACVPILHESGIIAACDDEFSVDGFNLHQRKDLVPIPPVAFCPWCGSKAIVSE
jgi:hypothetical protein